MVTQNVRYCSVHPGVPPTSSSNLIGIPKHCSCRNVLYAIQPAAVSPVPKGEIPPTTHSPHSCRRQLESSSISTELVTSRYGSCSVPIRQHYIHVGNSGCWFLKSVFGPREGRVCMCSAAVSDLYSVACVFVSVCLAHITYTFVTSC